MAKRRSKKQRRQHGMEVEDGAAAGGDDNWQTGPLVEDELTAMDVREAGAAQQPAAAPSAEKQHEGKRGARSTKQKVKKRKSLEKALAVASRVEAKAERGATRGATKKSLKKLWANDTKQK